MTFNTSHHAAWESRQLDLHNGSDDFDYSDFEGLPYEYVPKAKRWRDVETKEFVSESKAIDRNDEECERQIENSNNRYYDREIY